MQFGREDTLEECYEIKFCFKLGKNATEMYGMLQTAFGAYCMKVIDTLTQEDFHGAFQKLLELYNKCIAAGGDYFEGD